jgi:ligand-binding SRPBCC domain-containing protein
MNYETILEFRTSLNATAKEVFDFHRNYRNVKIVTPPVIVTRFLVIPETMQVGSKITVEIKLFGLWIPWDITVEKLEPDFCMIDYQSGRGPFKTWRHEHIFQEDNGRTILTDRITYQLPLGIVGAIADRLFMRFIQNQVFAYRHKKTNDYFIKK